MRSGGKRRTVDSPTLLQEFLTVMILLSALNQKNAKGAPQ